MSIFDNVNDLNIYLEEHFGYNPEIMDIVDSWYVEFTESGILSYNKKYTKY